MGAKYKAPDFAIFLDCSCFCLFFAVFLIFDQKLTQKGPGGLPKGLGRHSASFGQSFSPNGPIRAPFCFSISQKPNLGPNSSKSIIPNEVLGPWDPGWGKRAAPGGRRGSCTQGKAESNGMQHQAQCAVQTLVFQIHIAPQKGIAARAQWAQMGPMGGRQTNKK